MEATNLSILDVGEDRSLTLYVCPGGLRHRHARARAAAPARRNGRRSTAGRRGCSCTSSTCTTGKRGDSDSAWRGLALPRAEDLSEREVFEHEQMARSLSLSHFAIHNRIHCRLPASCRVQQAGLVVRCRHVHRHPPVLPGLRARHRARTQVPTSPATHLMMACTYGVVLPLLALLPQLFPPLLDTQHCPLLLPSAAART